MRLRGLAVRLVLVILLLASLVSCGLFVSFSGYDTSNVTPLYGVSGTVDGLAGARVQVVLNEKSSVPVAADGSFTFARELLDGAGFVVSVQTDPPFRTCRRQVGTIMHADATGVAIHCDPSSNASLASLTVSAGPLSPTFDPALTVYTTGPVTVATLFASRTTTTVTATVRDAGATIAIAGVATASRAPSAAIALAPDPTSIEVVVTAADGRAQKRYQVIVDGSPSDYIKASNTRSMARFGNAVALSGDTLAVGSYHESSAATGINSDQADISLTGAGAVYVFTRAGTTWSQQAYIKASNTRINASFGDSVALTGDMLAVGSSGESSSATGVNGNQADDPPFSNAGAGLPLHAGRRRLVAAGVRQGLEHARGRDVRCFRGAHGRQAGCGLEQ